MCRKVSDSLGYAPTQICIFTSCFCFRAIVYQDGEVLSGNVRRVARCVTLRCILTWHSAQLCSEAVLQNQKECTLYRPVSGFRPRGVHLFRRLKCLREILCLIAPRRYYNADNLLIQCVLHLHRSIPLQCLSVCGFNFFLRSLV